MTSNLLIENSTATHESARGIIPIKVSLVPGRKRIAVLRPRGSLDFSTYRDLIAEARGVYDVGMCCLVLDLCETPSISSSGLVALHNIAVMLQGKGAPDPDHGWQAIHALERDMGRDTQKRLKIVTAQPKVAQLLQRPFYARFLDIYTDLDAAIASCRQPYGPCAHQASSESRLPEPDVRPL